MSPEKNIIGVVDELDHVQYLQRHYSPGEETLKSNLLFQKIKIVGGTWLP